jgi:hypothetical protein
MALMMFGPVVFLAASVSPSTAPAPPVAERQVAVRASATATATIRIISGVRFGADQAKEAPGADRRSSLLADANGTMRAAELLEFQ